LNFIRDIWFAYFKNHGIGPVEIEDVINTGNFPKPIHWPKLIIAGNLFDQLGYTGNMCFVDSDIVMYSNAPAIFQGHPETRIGLVPETENLPYPLDQSLLAS
jgi:hypothetical protein